MSVLCVKTVMETFSCHCAVVSPPRVRLPAVVRCLPPYRLLFCPSASSAIGHITGFLLMTVRHFESRTLHRCLTVVIVVMVVVVVIGLKGRERESDFEANSTRLEKPLGLNQLSSRSDFVPFPLSPAHTPPFLLVLSLSPETSQL